MSPGEAKVDYSKKWEIRGKMIGEGGQAKVYRVIPKSMGHSVDVNMIHAIKELGNQFNGDDHRKQEFEQFKKNLFLLFERKKPKNQKALKVLHKLPEDARDFELAEKRLKNEIKAMSEISHPNLLNIVDFDLDSKWYVSDFFPRGSLSEKLNVCAGDFLRALKAFRPLVEGVAELHKQKRVHRDIKPANIFLDADNNLVLGDFGLVFFEDDEKTRISKTLDIVGSRDWMPPWAQSVPIEDINPTFDVFSLGKVLWSLVSGQPKLLFWYFANPRYAQYNVEELFPDAPFIQLANPLFKMCIVDVENACLHDASVLLVEVDKVLAAIAAADKTCGVCGVGDYQLLVDGMDDQAGIVDFGLTPKGVRKFQVLKCSNCGYVQLFTFEKFAIGDKVQVTGKGTGIIKQVKQPGAIVKLDGGEKMTFFPTQQLRKIN